MGSSIELDKTYSREITEDYGAITMRVVVFARPAKPKDGHNAAHQMTAAPGPDLSDEDDDFLVLSAGKGKSPLDSYLERPDGKGKLCVVFLLNGQRHEGWDATFIGRDLQFRYLRTRTIVAVELDGLKQGALDDILRGDRSGLYRGGVYEAIRQRMLATLKRDPDLVQLEAKAQEEASDLADADVAIRKKLDQLIQNLPQDVPGAGPPETEREQVTVGRDQLKFGFGADEKQKVVVEGGDKALEPFLIVDGVGERVRLRPGKKRTFELRAQPRAAWAQVKVFDVRIKADIPGLTKELVELEGGGCRVILGFEEPNDWDEEQYPIETTIQVLSKFDGEDSLRVAERELEISPPPDRVPRTPPQLYPEPTLLRVASRQPVKLVAGGPSTHVRMKWNGFDRLLVGANAPWRVETRCKTLLTFPSISHSSPRSGKFDLLLDTPKALLPDQKLEFDVTAHGPSGKTLTASFVGRVEILDDEQDDIVGASTRTKILPRITIFTPPKYRLKLITEAEWSSEIPYWSGEWNANSVASFVEPSAAQPLMLVINQDFGLLKGLRQEMTDRKLSEATMAEKQTRYVSHVALHLYAMYLHRKRRDEECIKDPGTLPLEESDQRAEIERVAATIMKLL